MKPEETVDYNIKVAWHAIARMYGQQASRVDMTTSIGFVLLNIDPTVGTPTTKIAPMMGLEARSLTRLLKSMESKGLIYRVPDEQDRRSVRIRLTHKGLERREYARLTVRHFNYAVQQAIPAAELLVFFKVIRQINTMIDGKAVYPPDFDPLKKTDAAS